MKAVMTPDNASLIILSDSMLMNRVQREAQAVATSFDLIAREAVAHIEEMYGLVTVLVYMGLKELIDPGDDLRRICAIVLTNALKSLTAAFALVRTGWRLQPNSCLRNGIEAASVVLHLIQHPEDLEKFRSGRLDSTKTIKAAKVAIPVIGPLYGILNEEFVHVGKPFMHIQNGNLYTESEPEMWQNLAGVAGFALMLYIVTELLFLNKIADAQCWQKCDETGCQQQFSEKIKAWREEFVKIYGPHYQKK
jgi:hypothetical protein